MPLLLLLLLTCPPRCSALRRDWLMVKSALKTYADVYGDVNLMPYSFTVPANSREWLPEWQGWKLGQVMSRIRTRGDFAEHKEDLKTLGIQSLEEKQEGQLQTFIRALQYFQREHNNTLDVAVPSRYKIPSDCEEEDLRGYKLGERFLKLRKKEGFFDQIDVIQNSLLPGSTLRLSTYRDRRGINELLLALSVYQKEYGDLFVPHAFVVPHTPTWPEETHGLKLGFRVSHARNRGSFAKHRAALDGVGPFPWVVRRDREFLKILDGLLASEGGMFAT